MICTGEPIGSTVPAGAFWAVTVSGGDLRSICGDAVSLAATMAAMACCSVRPITFGTLVVGAVALLMTLMLAPSILIGLPFTYCICRSAENLRDPLQSCDTGAETCQ